MCSMRLFICAIACCEAVDGHSIKQIKTRKHRTIILTDQTKILLVRDGFPIIFNWSKFPFFSRKFVRGFFCFLCQSFAPPFFLRLCCRNVLS